MVKQEKKFYQSVWFWVIIGFAFLTIVVTLEPNNQELITCKQQLNQAQYDLVNIQIAIENYVEALEDYCELDPYNLLCFQIN